MNRNVKLIVRIILFIGIVAFAIYMADAARENESIRNLVAQYGYVGIFVIAIISGFNLIVPIPAISFLPLFLESGQNFWLTILFITAGMAVADIAAYLLGGIGRDMAVSAGNKYVEKLQTLHDKHKYAPLIILFLFASLAPLPNELLLLPLAFFGYRAIQILPIVFVGNFVFNLLYASGFTSLLNLF